MDNNLSLNSDVYSGIVDAQVYITSEDPPEFYVRNIQDPLAPERKVNRFLTNLAIMSQSGLVSEDFAYDRSTVSLTQSSTYIYKMESQYTIRNHEVFKADWHYSKTGQWTYVVR